MRLAAALACLGASSCGLLPDEFNLAPIYRHRYAPDGSLAELEMLWPLVHYDRVSSVERDVRLRPLWRRITNSEEQSEEHQFLVPFGGARSDPKEFTARFLPLFFYRRHLELDEPGAWDINWWFTPLIWGGASHDGENYFAVFPLFGSIPDFLTYDRFSFFLFPLSLWTRRGKTRSTSLLWPLIGWGSTEGDPTRPHWWRFLPFFGQSIYPGKWEAYTALWPFFHWGRERLGKKFPYDSFFFFPIVGWKSGGSFLSWTFLWPFFRHAHKVDGPVNEGEEGTFLRWDILWPIFRYVEDTWSEDDELHQRWITPLIAWTRTEIQESLLLLFPFIWLRRFWNEDTDRKDTFILPFFWRNRIRHKTEAARGTREKLDADSAYEPGEDVHWRLYPLADRRQRRDGSWKFRTLSPWPWDGLFAEGVREAYDWIWTLAKHEGDALGNTRLQTLGNVYTHRNFAGQRFQSSLSFLFNYESDERTGERTLRLFQVFPIRWNAKAGAK